MPLVSRLGEQSLNYSIEDDQSGLGVFLVPDSDSNLFGLVQELDSNARQVYAFFIQGDSGQVTERFYIGEDVTFLISQTDQDAFVVYPENGDFETFPPIRLRADGTASVFEGDLDEFPPTYRFNGNELTRFDSGSPAGRATQTRVEGGTASVYLADDGDGSGVFLRVVDSEGNVVGGVIRVNADTSGDQVDPIVARLDEAFTVAWTQAVYDGSNTEEYRATTYRVEPNLGLAITADAGNDTLSGDVGDYVTDLFFYDTASDNAFGRDRVNSFGVNDILVTTSAIEDRNGDGVIDFGSDRRLDLTDASGGAVGEIAFTGLRSLEFDGAVQDQDGVTYYVYSRVGSDADEHYLIV
jgi:hypothetical protein